MRRFPVLLLAVGLSLFACDQPDTSDISGPSTGTLIVSTSTEGGDPDPDGYLLSVDDADSVHLDSEGTTEVDILPGLHTLRLLGVAAPCDVAPGPELEVDVPMGDTISVAFDVHCPPTPPSPPTPPTGAQITVATTGLDRDGDGYRLVVDGGDRGAIAQSGTLFVRLEPGSRTIALADLAPNCTADGPDTVAVVQDAVAQVAVTVVCTATSGVIGVTLTGAGEGPAFELVVDDSMAFPFRVGSSDPSYVSGVPPGDHVVSLTPHDNCSVETNPQSVIVTAGGLIRDTVEVAFSVTCVTAVRITVQTTGSIPSGRYGVWLCTINDRYYCTYGARVRLGHVDPNGTLVAEVTPGIHQFFLDDLQGCAFVRHSPTGLRNPTDNITFVPGGLRDLTFYVEC